MFEDDGFVLGMGSWGNWGETPLDEVRFESADL